MARIIVMADESDERITHTEWVTPADFDTEHFRTQLAERVAWAVDDAAEIDGVRSRAGGTRPSA